VATDGTARGLQPSWSELGLPPTLYAKTGTLNEPGDPTPTDDLFAKSLLFALGEPADEEPGALDCGIAGGIYIRFSQGPSSGNLPSHQVDFAQRRLGSFLRDYWARFGACPATPEEGVLPSRTLANGGS
jgi:hypothetical protein